MNSSFRRRFRRRRGAVLSMELLLVIPIVFGLFLAIVEFSLLYSGLHRVEAASRAAGRVASLPATDPVELEQAVRVAVEDALGKPKLVAAYQLSYDPGQYTGDPVTAWVGVPMEAASPDLLAVLGITLSDRQLTAETVMRKE